LCAAHIYLLTTSSKVKLKRAERGETYWQNTSYNKPTHWEQELDALKQAGTKRLHGVYIMPQPGAIESFKKMVDFFPGGEGELHELTKGPEGIKMLIDLLVISVLKDVGGEKLGEIMVKSYRGKFSKVRCYSFHNSTKFNWNFRHHEMRSEL